MATLSSAGIGSGLDVQGIVTQLVAAERGPKQNQINKANAQIATKITAMGSLKGALGAFQNALSSLKTTDIFNSRTAKSGDEKIFTVSADSTATAGSYDVHVEKLAKAPQLSSDAFVTGATEVVGTGQLKIETGTKSFSVTIDEEHKTLADIRDAINKSTDNTDIKATIVKGTDGAHLVLTSSKTGEANAIKISTTEGDGGLARLTYSAPGDVTNFTELKPAQDSVIIIAGQQSKNDSNVVKGAIDGVTLTLLAENKEVDDVVSLDVALDTGSITSRINNFVAQYNGLASTMASLQSYNADTKVAGPLLGDSLLRSIESDLRSGLVTPVSGTSQSNYQTLASLGITTKKDGTLEVNAEKLKKAIETDSASVAQLFGSENGIAARLDKQIAPRLAAEGDIAARNKGLDKRSATLKVDQTTLEARLAVVQQRYMKQFTALDSLLSNMSSTSSYLAQQLSSIANIGNS
jgi:flagellar hook-associated protein 2